MILRSLLVLWLVAASAASAQEGSHGPYRVKLRATLSGSSDTSGPAQYKVYSGVAIEVAVARDMGPLALELSLRTESREVEAAGSGPHLGSLEVLPVGLALQWRPRSSADHAFQPYVGAGAWYAITWEKSGALDSIDVPAHLGPLVQLGFDHRLSPRTFLNLDARWGTLRVDLSEFDPTAREVKVDPLVLGLGLALFP